MRSVAIVGLGWLGLPLARYLKQLGWEVKGTKRTFEGVESMRLLRLDTYHLELTPEINADPDDLAQLLDVDALVINIPPSQYFFDLQQYIDGIQNLIAEALIHGVSHFIFISSTSVFPNKTGKYDENTIPEPDTEVGKALVEIEQALLQFQDVDCDIIRFGGLIGEDRHPINSLAGRKNLKSGNTPVNLVHLDDCARAIQLLLETPGGHHLYHVVAPSHPKRSEYYTNIALKTGVKVPQFNCQQDDPQRIILGDKICREQGFVYQHPDLAFMLHKK